jgi:hypothetical protein
MRCPAGSLGEGVLVLKKIALGVVLVIVALVALVYAAGMGLFGSHEAPGDATIETRPARAVLGSGAKVAAAAAAIGVRRPKQVLFGDLHVHTTFSLDAFMLSLPALGGEGAHPPADACDFARFCSALDFWSINDHAFGITPEHWRETVESIRQCNDVAGGGASPDTVAFLGWEWTQVGVTPDDHYGHKNVVLRHTDADRIPSRPIAALRSQIGGPPVLRRGVWALLGGGRVHDMATYFAEMEAAARCDPDAHVRELPGDCVEEARTPADLFRKLDEWGHEAIVIPHGTTWGFYTPPGSTWDKQLEGGMHDPQRQTLLEVYSGHGDSEVYRTFRAMEFDDQGQPVCPAPRGDYLPSCWQAGEIIRERCAAAGLADDECERRAVQARAHAAAAGVAGHRTVPGAQLEDWLDAGQCRDCQEPSFNYRPGGSAQYILALGDFDAGTEQPRRFRLGFMASSDNHFARPGTGYKERYRWGMTESRGGAVSPDGPLATLFAPPPEGPQPESRPFDLTTRGFQMLETERQSAFFLTGGLVGVHAEGRNRDAIWRALERKEVYGTTGPRILLWFELLNPPGSTGETIPMGGEVEMSTNPIFGVRAVGSFEQKPGCPDYAIQSLSPERIEHLCKGDCYNPSDRRRLITRIDVIRIRPRTQPDEDVTALIEDPWRSFDCEPSPAGCAVTFEDPDFATGGRDAVYYARVFEEAKPGINAAGLRCEYDEEGRCIRVQRCPGSEDPSDDCLAEHEPRAWSSPIFVDHASPQR